MSAAVMPSIKTARGLGFALPVNTLSSEKPMNHAPKFYGQDQAWTALKRHRS